MNTITLQNINKVKAELEKSVKDSRRKLFEMETLTTLWEIQQGKVDIFKNPKRFLVSLK